jgi:hypothetical protein
MSRKMRIALFYFHISVTMKENLKAKGFIFLVGKSVTEIYTRTHFGKTVVSSTVSAKFVFHLFDSHGLGVREGCLIDFYSIFVFVIMSTNRDLTVYRSKDESELHLQHYHTACN